MLNIGELKNRVNNECLPLPIIYALQNPEIKSNLLPLLNADLLNENVQEKIVETVLESCEVEILQKLLISNVNLRINKRYLR